MTTPTETELAEMEDFYAHSSPGPWEWDDVEEDAFSHGGGHYTRRTGQGMLDLGGCEQVIFGRWHDARCAAKAHELLPRLIEYVRALRTQLATRTAERDALQRLSEWRDSLYREHGALADMQFTGDPTAEDFERLSRVGNLLDAFQTIEMALPAPEPEGERS